MNRRELPESTPDDFAFRYIDIGAVSTGAMQLPEETTFAAAPTRARRLAPPGAVVVSTVRTYLRAIAPVVEPGLVFSTGFAVLEAKEGVDPRYLYYSCLSEPFLASIEAKSTGVSYPAVSPNVLASLEVELVMEHEQRRIADFLDDQVARLDAAQQDVEYLSAALQTRSQIAVDNIYDGSGGRPRLRSLLQQHPQYGVLVPYLVDEGVPFIRIRDLPGVRKGDASGFAHITVAQSREYRRTIVRPGDVLLGVVGSIDSFAVVPGSLAGANVARAVARLIPRPDVPTGLLTGFLQTTSYRRQALNVTEADTAQPTLNMSDLRGFVVPLPAVHASEVAAAVCEVEDQRRDGLWEARSLLRLLEERKRALVTACVTGEFDVATASSRAAGAALAGAG